MTATVLLPMRSVFALTPMDKIPRRICTTVAVTVTVVLFDTVLLPQGTLDAVRQAAEPVDAKA